MNKRILVAILIAISFVFLAGGVVAVPSGARNITVISTTSSDSDSPGNNSAQAGNITELNVFGYSTTQSWQGYFGNVTGTIQLANSGGNVMYNWSTLSPNGEIFSSRNGTITWSYVQCFNFTANGSYGDDTGQAGGTSLGGKNLSQLETDYNIGVNDSDGVNETFSLNDHSSFSVGALSFGSGECKNTKLFNNTGGKTFDEVLLYEPVGRSVIFSSMLQNNGNSFTGGTSDFEMVVLEDGHSGDITVTPYYFYLELG